MIPGDGMVPVSPSKGIPDHRCVGFLDIGTNSIRLLVVRIGPEGVPVTISRQKAMIRLGEGEFSNGQINGDAITRCVLSCGRFTALAQRLGADEIIAVATSAIRDAQNREMVLARIQEEANIQVRVISGREEARLIYLGVAGSFPLGSRQALFIDIGGGSTEIVVGSSHEYWFLASHPLGAIRLTGEHFPGKADGPVSRRAYLALQAHISGVLDATLTDCGRYRLDYMVGSSGTLLNLAEIAARRRTGPGGQGPLTVTREEIKQVIAYLASLPLEARREVPGINPGRADIIIAGAAVAEVVMDTLAIPEMGISTCGLQDGLLAEYLARFGQDIRPGDHGVQERSVIHLLRVYGVNMDHAGKIAAIACSLYDSSAGAGLFSPLPWEREMLRSGALLHDIGTFIGYEDHHHHSAYIIKNSVLPGFSWEDITILATLVRFHRKRSPRMSSPELEEVPRGLRRSVLRLCTLLRLSEALEHASGGCIIGATLEKNGKECVTLKIHGHEPVFPASQAVVLQERDLFRKAFGTRLIPGDETDHA